MKRLLFLILVLPLCGCVGEQRRQLAACQYEVLQSLPHDTQQKHHDPDVLDYSSPGQHLVFLCMQAHGYEKDWTDDRCQPGRENFATEVYCYAPVGPFYRLIFEIERRLF
jgi:hypothetical protein